MNALRYVQSFVALCSAALLLASAPLGAQDFDKAQIKTEKLAPNLYVLFGAGGNIGVSIGDDAVFMIDDQYAPMAPKIAEAIRQLTDKPVKFLLNTHWHGDHTGGNEILGAGGALIVAHDNVRKRMSSEQFIKLFGSKVAPSPKAALPVVTFASTMTLHINGDEILAFHIPNAHTDGDAIVYFRKGNVIHMGDTFFNGLYPFIDSSSGGHPDGVIAVADRVLALANDSTRIIPGHGPVSGKADLKIYRDMLVTVTTRVKELVAKGKTLDEIIASKPAAEFDERWGKAFIKPEQFIAMLVGAYRDMGGAPRDSAGK